MSNLEHWVLQSGCRCAPSFSRRRERFRRSSLNYTERKQEKESEERECTRALRLGERLEKRVDG